MVEKYFKRSIFTQINAHADDDRPTLKDGSEGIFRNGLFRQLEGIYTNIESYGNNMTKRTENVTPLPKKGKYK